MKTYFLTLVGLALIMPGFAQTGPNVPAAVQTAFANAYPTAQNAKWEKDKKDYEVAFTMDQKTLELKYNGQGTLLEKEEKMEEKALPAGVQNTLNKEFGDYSVKEAEQVDRSGVVTYEVVVQKGKAKYELTLEPSGKLLKKEKD